MKMINRRYAELNVIWFSFSYLKCATLQKGFIWNRIFKAFDIHSNFEFVWHSIWVIQAFVTHEMKRDAVTIFFFHMEKGSRCAAIKSLIWALFSQFTAAPTRNAELYPVLTATIILKYFTCTLILFLFLHLLYCSWLFLSIILIADHIKFRLSFSVLPSLLYFPCTVPFIIVVFDLLCRIKET